MEQAAIHERQPEENSRFVVTFFPPYYIHPHFL
jgi:hypothetical protein